MEFNPFWGTPRSRNVKVKNTFIGKGQSYVNIYSPIGVTFDNCQFDKLTFSAKRNAKNILLKDISWSNSDKILKADPDVDIHLRGEIKIDGKTASDADITKRSIVGKKASITLPSGKDK